MFWNSDVFYSSGKTCLPCWGWLNMARVRSSCAGCLSLSSQKGLPWTCTSKSIFSRLFMQSHSLYNKKERQSMKKSWNITLPKENFIMQNLLHCIIRHIIRNANFVHHMLKFFREILVWTIRYKFSFGKIKA